MTGKPAAKAAQHCAQGPAALAMEKLAALGDWSLGLKVAGRRILHLNGKRYGAWDIERGGFAKETSAEQEGGA
ncbi:MAG: hypothetical protein LBJ84_07430 [Oscillospiraceae bacterium]|nr:hypothetical protein [Oscillospiraceae bacterium]